MEETVSLEDYLRVLEEAQRAADEMAHRRRDAALRFGAALRKARLQHDLFRRAPKLAKQLKVDPEEILNLERGLSTNLTLAWNVAVLLDKHGKSPTPGFPEPWTDHPVWTSGMWCNHVMNGDTRLGYIEWVFHQEEALGDG